MEINHNSKQKDQKKKAMGWYQYASLGVIGALEGEDRRKEILIVFEEMMAEQILE